MSRKYTTDEFILQAKSIHGNKYDYSKVVYNDRKTKVIIICNSCHNHFLQIPSDHIFKKSGCPRCSKVEKLNTQSFIIKAIQKHPIGKYDYSKVIYINARTKIEIKCNDCNNIFWQVARDHLSGYGCKNCSIVKSKYTTEEFILKSKEIHCDIYDYSNVIYINIDTKVKIKCNKCNKTFEQTPSSHLEGKGCPSCCSNNISKSEINWLNTLNIPEEYRNKYIKISDILYKLDAYDPITNTIYEFYGDYWHGNPKIFNINDINKNNKKTFGELYYDTIYREKLLISAGYNIISIWEHDWNILQKKGIIK